jgi:hypothetical protein
VLIAITLWIVWPAHSGETLGAATRGEEDTHMMPQGDEFEDQYTSATADLSAGGVAAAIDAMQENEAAAPTPIAYGAAGEPWSSPTMAREGTPDFSAAPASLPTMPAQALPPPRTARPRTVGLGAAALTTLGIGAGGAWLYARWQRQRNAPLNRLRRTVRGLDRKLR